MLNNYYNQQAIKVISDEFFSGPTIGMTLDEFSIWVNEEIQYMYKLDPVGCLTLKNLVLEIYPEVDDVTVTRADDRLEVRLIFNDEAKQTWFLLKYS